MPDLNSFFCACWGTCFISRLCCYHLRCTESSCSAPKFCGEDAPSFKPNKQAEQEHTSKILCRCTISACSMAGRSGNGSLLKWRRRTMLIDLSESRCCCQSASDSQGVHIRSMIMVVTSDIVVSVVVWYNLNKLDFFSTREAADAETKPDFTDLYCVHRSSQLKQGASTHISVYTPAIRTFLLRHSWKARCSRA